MPAETSQTLDRGLTVLELLADAPDGLSITELAASLSVSRTVVYRLVNTLELHRLVRRDSEGRARLGLAVLHYSRRSARAFLDAARDEGVEISALAIPQCCLSETVASVLRDAGASQVLGAATPDENALFDTLERALRTRLA